MLNKKAFTNLEGQVAKAILIVMLIWWIPSNPKRLQI
jgi:hypothetical protein